MVGFERQQRRGLAQALHDGARIDHKGSDRRRGFFVCAMEAQEMAKRAEHISQKDDVAPADRPSFSFMSYAHESEHCTLISCVSLAYALL